MEFRLPDIGEGLTEGEVTRWLVKEGDAVRENQPLVEVMTDKATVEIPAPRTGRVASIRVPEGKTVPIGTVLVVIEESGGAAAPAPVAAPAAAQATAATRPVGHAPAASSGDGDGAGGKALAAPATRARARELGVDLGRIAGTGPRGRITVEDVERAASGSRAAPARPEPGRGASAPGRAVPVPAARPAPAPLPSGPREERIPLRGVRKKIAEHMVHSKHTAPHYTYVEQLDATDLVALRNEAKRIGEARGVKVTYLPFVIKALVAGFREFPLLNASLDDATGEIVVKRYYNIGIATAGPDGLIVPVVKDCDRRSLWEIAAEIQRIADSVRAGKVALEDLRGGTFTITNAGNIGGVLATPIINHPEVAILGINKIRETPVVRSGQIVIRQVCHLSLSLDHRVVDGAIAAEFMNRVVRLLEDPKLQLLETM
ncbi:MAG: 2-oxo acid dehydrogenase subunit E2 [Planctomycetales bacterium]|nr:2-oxo acid dehydrogenase subunit E2 [Planctomycetales bacterium]